MKRIVSPALSKGMSVHSPREDSDFRSIFCRANLEMYEDKRVYYTHSANRRRH